MLLVHENGTLGSVIASLKASVTSDGPLELPGLDGIQLGEKRCTRRNGSTEAAASSSI